ncbi:hypothetical protein TMEN_6949 [Trichophyton mentagrophytes]|uniref:Rad51 family DNA repair protein n=1 Tax=Trichophyton tonsurans (strain CBS 112818) TaxID=647933 RepID=F2RX10_TRIT1|nr:hypothetical protein TESG_03323 [Trichophyton tonsurans CBS 112818]GBF64260.1 hypothetical protein TMEN_6949 [Trichophyton mentagrophytes]
MATRALGKRLREETQEDTLEGILRDVRRKRGQHPQGHIETTPVGVRVIDDMLRIFHRPPHPRPGVPDRHKVLEIAGPRRGLGRSSGKSSLLYYIAAVGILPASFKGVRIGGQNGAVVFLDSQNHFNAARLRDVALHYAREKLHGQKQKQRSAGLPPRKRLREDEAELRKMVTDCLQHVHVFKPSSSESVVATLRSLEEYLLDVTRHRSAPRKLHSIMLDSTSSFYFKDKRQALIDSLPTELPKFPWTEPPPLYQIVHSAKHIVWCLRQLQDRFACTVIYTVTGRRRADLHVPKPSGFGYPVELLYPRPKIMSFMPHLPHAWRSYSTMRLVVRRDAVRKFSSRSIKDALRLGRQRRLVVAQGKFSAWIDPYGKEDWPSWIGPSIQKSKCKGRFNYFVHKRGINLVE